MVNTVNFLDNEDLNNINRSYALAFLRSKGVNHSNFEPIVDNHWNFGPFEDGLLIRTDNASFFSAFTWPELTHPETDNNVQVIGSAIHEKFLDLIAFLIASKQTELALDNVDFAFYLNHNRMHYTCLLVRFEGLDGEEYKKLYQAYQAYQDYSMKSNDSADELAAQANKPRSDIVDQFAAERNNIRNFLLLSQNISLNYRDTSTEALTLSNWRLPIPVRTINLKHIDSLGVNAGSHKAVRATCELFLQAHNAPFYKVRTLTTQAGNTCGDWSVYNSYRFAVVNKSKRHAVPTSIELRTLAENKSIENASQILLQSQRQLVNVNPEDQINIAARDFPTNYEIDEATESDEYDQEEDGLWSFYEIDEATESDEYDQEEDGLWSFIKDNMALLVAVTAVCLLVNPLVTIAWPTLVSVVGLKAAFAGTTVAAACLFGISLGGFFQKKKPCDDAHETNQLDSTLLETEEELLRSKQDRDASIADTTILHQYTKQKDNGNREPLDNVSKAESTKHPTAKKT